MKVNTSIWQNRKKYPSLHFGAIPVPSTCLTTMLLLKYQAFKFIYIYIYCQAFADLYKLQSLYSTSTRGIYSLSFSFSKEITSFIVPMVIGRRENGHLLPAVHWVYIWLPYMSAPVHDRIGF